MRTQDRIYILDRLANYNQSAEGSTLPPQLSTGNRVPFVSRLKVQRQDPGTGSNTFFLTFIEPDRGDIRNYNVFYSFENNYNFLTGPISCLGSPAVITIPTASDIRVTFFVQTVLTSGLSSSPLNSPSCTAVTI